MLTKLVLDDLRSSLDTEVKEVMQKVDTISKLLEEKVTSLPKSVIKRVESDSNYVAQSQIELDTFTTSPPSTGTLVAPYLGYVYYSNPSDSVAAPVPTPILIRNVQRPILSKQAQARTRPIPQVSTATSSKEEPLDLIKKVKSGGLSPKFDSFVDQYPLLAGKVQTAKDKLAGIGSAAQQLDDDFVTMLDGFDPLLDAAIVVLNEPLGYEPTLTPIVAKLAKSSGFPTDMTEKMSTTFAAMKNVEQSLGTFKSLKISAAFSHYSKRFGSNITTLRSFVAAVRIHLDSLDHWFIFLNEVIVSIINNQSRLSAENKSTMLAKIDALFGSLLPIINDEINKIQKIPDEVAKLYSYLSSLYKDVQIFFQASADVFQICSALEAKLIAADRIATFCTSLNTGMLQLDTVLNTLEPSQVMDLSLSTIPVDEAMKSINSLLSSQFKLEDVQTDMAKVVDSLSKVNIATHLATFDQELGQLVALVQIKERDAKAVFVTDRRRRECC
ncbi:hypothetical protein BKA63DRAFT_554297 [Paraphoma chrysanthemicola]|nr:hypothetical protein BKA63DRAFT_554297 [Paraphoma chrysanthemicola]